VVDWNRRRYRLPVPQREAGWLKIGGTVLGLMVKGERNFSNVWENGQQGVGRKEQLFHGRGKR
jgi:hypothetical protein